MMFLLLLVFGLAFHLTDVINFFLSSYFIKIETLPVMLIFLVLILEDYKIYVVSVILAVLFGTVDNKVHYYIVVLFSVTYLLKKSKEHFLLDTPSFLFVFSFLFVMVKTILYWIYIEKYSKLTSLLMSEYLFNIFLNALLAYPIFVSINRLYKAFLRFYEKNLHYA